MQPSASSTLNNGSGSLKSPRYDCSSRTTVPLTDTHATMTTSSASGEGLSSFISTAELESKLQSLREQSNKLSQELTQRLATSESGQNLMQIGPSLSTLPPDLHSLITCIQPLLNDVEEYVEANSVELNRLQQYQLDIEACSTRAQHARQCASIYEDLCAGERDVQRDLALLKNFSTVVAGDGPFDDNVKEDYSHFVDNVASLERAAHVTVYLLQELEKSTAQLSAVTATTTSKPNQSDQTTIASSISVSTEKAQFFSKLAPRILKLESEGAKCLISRLDSILTRMSLDVNNKKLPRQQQQRKNLQDDLLAIGHCLRGLAMLGKGKEAESIFARVAIMPLLRSKVSIGKIDEGGSRGECTGLFSLLDDIAHSISSTFGPVLCLSECIFGVDNVDNFSDESDPSQRVIDVDLVTAGVWIPIATTLMADPAIKMAIFSPGIASILQANFMALDIFVSELASRLLSSRSFDDEEKKPATYTDCNDMTDLYFDAKVCPAAVQAAQMRIYAHPTTLDFSKKWNLPIYYQLRFGECCTRLNRAIARVQREGWGAEVFTGSISPEFLLREKMSFEIQVFSELYDILLSLWKSDVFIRPLANRFLRGTVQLLGRLIAFAKEGIEGDVEPPGSATLPNNGEVGKSVPSPLFSWREKAEDVAAVAWDMAILERCMTEHYLDTVLAAVAPKEMGQQSNVHNSEEELNELRSLISEVLLEASQEMGPFIIKCWMEVISGIITTKCCAPLSAVKGVAATYRMTNRPPPTQASHFVSTILRPLKEFDDAFRSRTPAQVGSDWRRNVVGTVSERYSAAVEELLETVRRTEEALKSRKARRTAGAVGMSDGDKVKLQLLLDYKEFTKAVADVGVDESLVEGVIKLKSLTEEAETILAQMQNGDT